MVLRHGKLQRLSRHLRLGGDHQWKNSSLVGKEVSLYHCCTGEVLAAGRLEYNGSGFHIDNQQVYLRGIAEVSPKEHKIIYNPDYLDSSQRMSLDFRQGTGLIRGGFL